MDHVKLFDDPPQKGYFLNFPLVWQFWICEEMIIIAFSLNFEITKQKAGHPCHVTRAKLKKMTLEKPSRSICWRRTVREMTRESAHFLGLSWPARLWPPTCQLSMTMFYLCVQLLIGERKSGKIYADSIIGRCILRFWFWYEDIKQKLFISAVHGPLAE